MEMGTVLVAYDDTEFSKKAVGRAATLLSEGDSLVLLYVVPGEVSSGTFEEMVCPDDPMSAEDANIMINAAAGETFQRYHLQAVGMVRRGPPGPTIVEVARDLDATMVVVGVGAVEKVSCFMLGSVADYVARHSHVPVLIVR
jgi:nucleotide-binding universal stress UspA family protein